MSSKKVKSKSKAKAEEVESSTGSEEQESIEVPENLPVLTSRDLVAFPAVMMSLYVDAAPVMRAVEVALAGDNLMLILAVKDPAQQEIGIKDHYKLGVVGTIVRTFRLSDGRMKLLIQGLLRAKVAKFDESSGYLTAKVEVIPLQEHKPSAADTERVAQIRKNLQTLVEYEHLPEEMLLVTEEVKDPGTLCDIIVAHYKLDLPYAQGLLEELDSTKRIKFTEKIIQDDLNQFIISENIRDKTRDELSKGQREYYLREQIKQIQRELGESDPGSEDINSLKRALERAKLPKHAADEAFKQLVRLERMHPETSEYALLRTYLEWISDLPWSVRTRDRLHVGTAKKILNEDHFGLEKAKDRILEYLSVRKLKKDSKGPILCFVGPPGVGKTSLGRSVARCLNRRFVRMSLGGVRDEAEIRGHRRTYVGALPGRIIQGIKEAGSINPVFLFDELDKIGADFRGDPASALLEILDPEQNRDFRDHYLNISFDLSSCLFIATANTLDTIPDPLLDRLEVISIPGYTTDEKLSIAKRFLVPRQLREKGLEKQHVTFDDKTLSLLIERYTREAGVRSLEREVASLCRKLARELVEGGKIRNKVTPELVHELLGSTKYDPEVNEFEDAVGLVNGLAWTVHGGDLMQVEVSVAKGKGKLQLTGQLGDVMQESAQAAMFFARANAEQLGLDPEFQSNVDVHVHVPSGATPKDGPSAGITIVTALVSALADCKVSREIAMTGEITLRGHVLPIGGLKEKALAALRYGIKKVIIPFANQKDLEEIPKEQRERIEFIPVRRVDEVLDQALLRERQPKREQPRQKFIKRPLIVEP